MAGELACELAERVKPKQQADGVSREQPPAPQVRVQRSKETLLLAGITQPAVSLRVEPAKTLIKGDPLI